MWSTARKPLPSQAKDFQTKTANRVPLKSVYHKNTQHVQGSYSTYQQQIQKQQITKPPVKQLGMTSAISLEPPSAEDNVRTKELFKTLESHNIFESHAELEHRMAVLTKLDMLFKEWIRMIAMRQHIPKEAASKLGGKVCTFGSYRLGVHQKGADIDALCVAPNNIERKEFFRCFAELLKKQKQVTELRVVEDAFVPVIKMKFDGIEMDLLYARLALAQIPANVDMSDDNLLKTLDRYSVRSLNGCRVTDALLELVPNAETFRLALRAIKLWAKKHGVYSNSLGYFGGITWAILVARTCQLYPNAAAATIVYKFFMVFSRWTWPSPVLLKKPDTTELNLPVWDPRTNQADRYHLMPIITPAYPQQNSTFNVTESTKKVIVEALKRGLTTTCTIMAGLHTWQTLFEAPSFFYSYKHFVVLLVESANKEDHLLWCGLVESKIRLLVAKLERTQYIALAHINPISYDYKQPVQTTEIVTGMSTSEFCSMWFIGLEFEKTEKLYLDLTESIRSFTETVLQHALNTQMLMPGMNIQAHYVKRKQLTHYLGAEFLKCERRYLLSSKYATKTNRKRTISELSMSTSSEGDIEVIGCALKRSRSEVEKLPTEETIVID